MHGAQVPWESLPVVDRHMLHRFALLMDDLRDSYEGYQFSRFFQARWLAEPSLTWLAVRRALSVAVNRRSRRTVRDHELGLGTGSTVGLRVCSISSLSPQSSGTSYGSLLLSGVSRSPKLLASDADAQCDSHGTES